VPEKYEREIEEILRKTSFSAPKGSHRSSGWMNDLASAWRQHTADVSPTRLLVIGMVLALVGYFVRGFIPELGFPMSLVALGFLVGGLVVSMSQRNSRQPSRWRGQVIDVPVNNLWVSLKRRWDDWRHRGRWNGPGWR
jgi:hypothetical protein